MSRIFYHTDSDGDELRVSVIPDNRLSMQCETESGSKSVYLETAADVRRLRDALSTWLDGQGDAPVERLRLPEPVTVELTGGPAGPDPYRLAALNAAAARCVTSVAAETVVVVAREFEAYLRGPEAEAVPDVVKTNGKSCGHPCARPLGHPGVCSDRPVW